MIKEPKVILEDENQFYLPMGIEDEDGKVHRIVTLEPMTGETEEAMSDSKIASNSGKILTEMLKGIVGKIEGLPKVTKDIVRNMTIADRDFLMTKNYIVSFGDELEFEHKCTNSQCKVNNIIKVNVPSLKVNYLEDSEPRTLKLKLHNGVKNASGDVFKNIEVRFPTGEDIETVGPVARANAGQGNTSLLTRITLSIKNDNGGEFAPINFETFKKMSKKDRDYINRELKKATPGVDFEVITSCSGCGEELKSRIPATSFLAE